MLRLDGVEIVQGDWRLTADLALEAGSVTAVVGPSGAGKSTVLKCIWRTYLPEGGRMLLRHADGEDDLAAVGERRMLELRRRALRFVTQFLHVVPRQSALAVVAEPLLALGTPAEEARARAAAQAAQPAARPDAAVRH